MTKEELFEFIKKELNGCSGYAFIDNAIRQLDSAIKKQDGFDCEKFKKWFIDSNVIYKNSPLAFLTKCGITDINNGKFSKPKVKAFNIAPLCNAMRNRGIKVNEDIMYVEKVEIYLYNNELMTLEEIVDMNAKIVEWLARFPNSTTTDFVNLLKKSKTLSRVVVPWTKFDEEQKKDKEEWDNLLSQLDDIPYGNKDVEDDEESEIRKVYEKETD